MRVEGFDYTAKHFPTVAHLEAHLSAYEAPWWASEVTAHHTWKPTVAQWLGEASVHAMARYYRDTRKWKRGPHLYVAPDGIWELTPLNLQGIHAGICNAHSFGVEIVGNYDLVFWQPPIYELAYGTLVTLLHWIRHGAPNLHGHRECLPNKSCPGNRVSMEVVRTEAAKRLNDIFLRDTTPTGMPLAGKRYVITATSGANVRKEATYKSAKIGVLDFNRDFQVRRFLPSGLYGGPRSNPADPREGWLERDEGGYIWGEIAVPG